MLSADAIDDITVLHKTRKINIEPVIRIIPVLTDGFLLVDSFLTTLGDACFLTHTFGNGSLYFYRETHERILNFSSQIAMCTVPCMMDGVLRR